MRSLDADGDFIFRPPEGGGNLLSGDLSFEEERWAEELPAYLSKQGPGAVTNVVANAYLSKMLVHRAAIMQRQREAFFTWMSNGRVPLRHCLTMDWASLTAYDSKSPTHPSKELSLLVVEVGRCLVNHGLLRRLIYEYCQTPAPVDISLMARVSEVSAFYESPKQMTPYPPELFAVACRLAGVQGNISIHRPELAHRVQYQTTAVSANYWGGTEDVSDLCCIEAIQSLIDVARRTFERDTIFLFRRAIL